MASEVRVGEQIPVDVVGEVDGRPGRGLDLSGLEAQVEKPQIVTSGNDSPDSFLVPLF